jgi:hypothetical protein
MAADNEIGFIETFALAPDREAVLGRPSSAARTLALDAPSVRAAHEAVDALAGTGGWRRPATPR